GGGVGEAQEKKRPPISAGRRMAPNGSDDERALTDNSGMTRSFVGLGANLEAPQRQIERALELLGEEDGVEVVAVSTLRWTDPVGFEDQPRLLNGAAELAPTLCAHELLERRLSS